MSLPITAGALAGCVILFSCVWIVLNFWGCNSSVFYVLVLIIGVLFSSISLLPIDTPSAFKAVNAVDPLLLLYILLPLAFFGEAIKLNYFQVRYLVDSILLMGLVSAVIGMVLLCSLSYVMYSGARLAEIITFSASLVAIDPFLSLLSLKQANTLPSLTQLVVAYSLLTDVVVILIFENTLQYTNTTDSEVDLLAQVVVSLLAGTALGIAIGLFFWCFFMSTHKAFSDKHFIAQIACTVSVPLLGFSITEHLLHSPGVIAVVFGGMIFSFYCRKYIVHLVSFTHFWMWMEWFVNVLIFFLLGVLLTKAVVMNKFYWDWARAGILYLAVVAERIIMSSVLLPVSLKSGNCSYQTSKWREVVFVGWSSLPGAFSLILAILANANYSSTFSQRAEFAVAIVVILSILINGSTGSAILHCLHIPLTSESHLFIKKIENKLRQDLISIVSEIRQGTPSSEHMVLQVWTHLCNYITPLHDVEALAQHRRAEPETAQTCSGTIRIRRMFSTFANINQFSSVSPTLFPAPFSSPGIETINHVRRVYLEVVKAQYWQLIDSGITQQENSVALYLLHSVDIALNDFNNQLFDWEIVEHEVAASSLYRRCLQGMLDCTQRLESLASFYRRVLEIENRRHEEYCIMLCLVFYHAHETARNKLRYYLADELHGENNSALGGETELSQHYLTALEAVEDESLHQENACKSQLRAHAEETVRLTIAKQSVLALLQNQLRAINELRCDGLISDKDANVLHHRVLSDSRRIDRARHPL